MWREDKNQLMEMARPMEQTGPVHPMFLSELGVVVGGITKRELFAAMAMQTLVGKYTISHSEKDRSPEIAKASVELADVLLAELDKKKVHEWTEVRRGEEGAELHGCLHHQWTDLEHGVGQCKNCMRMLPYTAFGCAPDEA